MKFNCKGCGKKYGIYIDENKKEDKDRLWAWLRHQNVKGEWDDEENTQDTTKN